jgi:hypothetical protein
MEAAVSQTPVSTTRPDLIGKTVVHILDPYPHGGGVVPPTAFLYELAVIEADYTGIRIRGSLRWIYPSDSPRPVVREFMDLDRLEPGAQLDRYLPGASAWFGQPDFVYFQGAARKKWYREHATSAPRKNRRYRTIAR